jgi:flagellar hook-associated protein 2
MGSFSVGGLASGLDTKAIIDQLVQIDGRSKTRLEWKQQLWTARKSAWSDLNTRLMTLQTAANALINPSTWDMSAVPPPTSGPWGATSGDPSRLSATVTGPAPSAATHAINVLQLAQAQITRSSSALAPPTSGTFRTAQFFEAGTNNIVEGNESLNSLRTNAGGTLSVNTNSTFTMDWTVNGITQSATFTNNTVANGGDGNRLNNLATWVESTIGNGASAQWVNGALEVTTAPGSSSSLQDLSFTGLRSNNAPLAAFDALYDGTGVVSVAAFDGGVQANDTLTIASGSGTWNVALAAGDDKQAIVNKINATSGIGVFATLSGGEIEMRSNVAGVGEGFTVTSGGATAAQLGFTNTQAAQDAMFTVDGTAHSSATNTNIAGVITDVSLNLLGTTSTTLTVGQSSGSGPVQTTEDKWVAATKAKVQAFVAAYNDSLSFVHQKTQAESRIANPKNLGEYLQGSMARDVGFNGVAFDLRRQAGESVDGLPAGASMLSQIGIKIGFSVGGGAANGALTIDDAALDAALRADPQGVQDVLGKVGTGSGIDSSDGIVRRISDQVSMLRVGGRVDTSLSGAGNQVKSIQDAIDRATDRLDRRKVYYERMFSSLESTLGRLQSQGSWLSGQLAQLSGGQSN